MGERRLDAEDLEQAVYMTVGAGSACWQNLKGAGVFDDAQAREVAESLIVWIRERYIVNDPNNEFDGYYDDTYAGEQVVSHPTPFIASKRVDPGKLPSGDEQCSGTTQLLMVDGTVADVWRCRLPVGHDILHETYSDDGELLANWDTGFNFQLTGE